MLGFHRAVNHREQAPVVARQQQEKQGHEQGYGAAHDQHPLWSLAPVVGEKVRHGLGRHGPGAPRQWQLGLALVLSVRGCAEILRVVHIPCCRRGISVGDRDGEFRQLACQRGINGTVDVHTHEDPAAKRRHRYLSCRVACCAIAVVGQIQDQARRAPVIARARKLQRGCHADLAAATRP